MNTKSTSNAGQRQSGLATDKTWFRDPVGGTYYPSMERVRQYLPEDRSVEPSISPNLEITTETGVTYSFRPVWMSRMPSDVPQDWLAFLKAHVPGTTLNQAMQVSVQHFMREHRTECLTDRDGCYYTFSGGMLAHCDPAPFSEHTPRV